MGEKAMPSAERREAGRQTITTDRIVGVGNRLIESIDASTKELSGAIDTATGATERTGKLLKESLDAASEAQSAHDSAIRWLTGVIAIATVVYTVLQGLTLYSTWGQVP